MRLRAAAVAVVAIPTLLLAGCGTEAATSPSSSVSGAAGSAGAADGSAGASGAADGSADASGTAASAEAPVPGPEVPPATAVAAPVDKTQLPTASGKFGEKPTLTYPKTNPPNTLQRQVLSEGSGAEVKAGDWLIANYQGQVWDGKVFDNSYDRKKPSAFQIGVHKVVPGWDVGLVGMKVGSRVLLSLPPADGYASAGKPDAGIKGTDTIVFVVDIVRAIGPTEGGQSDVKAAKLPATAPTVTGDLGKQPKVVVAKGLAEPKKATVLPISKGTGPKIAADEGLLVQYEAVTWDNQPGGSTWSVPEAAQAQGQTAGPQQVQASAKTPFADLAGLTVGSRVLLEIPSAAADQASGAQAQPAIAVVIDIVAAT